MKRPIYVVLEAIRAIKIHVQENPNYLRHLYSDKDGNELMINRDSQLQQAISLFEDFDTTRPITITTSDQAPKNTFPVIVVNEEIMNDRARIGSGQGIDHFIAADGTESKMIHNLSDTNVSISIFSDRRNESDILGHVIYCGLVGLATHFEYHEFMNTKILKQPFRRLFEGNEDLDGINAVSITIQANLNVVVPPIDRTYLDFSLKGVQGVIDN